jgi:AraC-like DNA-binding protein
VDRRAAREEAALSRSTLHERFVHFIGQPPMQYLTQWRMQLATGRLRDSDAKVVDVALGVGYESEAAFARAFKRAVGKPPGVWRRVLRARKWSGMGGDTRLGRDG